MVLENVQILINYVMVKIVIVQLVTRSEILLIQWTDMAVEVCLPEVANIPWTPELTSENGVRVC